MKWKYIFRQENKRKTKPEKPQVKTIWKTK